MSLSESEQHALIARFQHGDTTVFDALYASIEQGVNGYIEGVLTRDAQEADEIAQDTRLYVFEQGLQRYNLTCGRLLPFVKRSARWMALRYYHERGQRGEMELLLSQLRVRHPDLDSDPELADILASSRGRVASSPEAMALDVEYERLQAQVYEELFELTFTHGTSPPHQLVALGFRLWPDPVRQDTGARTPPGKPSPVWPPRRIVAELSDTALTILVGQLEAGLVHAVTYLSEARLRAHLGALRQRLEQSVHAICLQLQLDLPPWSVAVAWHHGSGVGLTDALDALKRACIEGILRQCWVGTTTFRHYYTTPKPEDDIGHWCEAVKRQVWQAIRTQGKGPLFVLLQRVRAHRQREAARRAPARPPRRQQPPSQAAGDTSRL